MNKKSFPSLESVDDNEGGFNAGAEVMADHTDAVAGYEYEYEQMMDGRAEDSIVDAIEGAETEIASLESLLQAIDEARDVGMEAYSAQFANIQVSNAQRRYGVDSLDTMFPSMECFSGRQARTATSISMESVKETIAKIWAWIKEQFAKFIQMIKKFYAHLSKNLDLVIEEANRIKNIARKRDFEGGRIVHLGRRGKGITVQGKIPSDMGTITSVLNTVAQSNRVPEEKFEKIRNDVETAIAKNKADFHLLPASMTGEVPLPASFQHLATYRHGATFAGARKAYMSPTLPGDRGIVIAVFGDDNTDKSFSWAEGQFVTGKVDTVWEDIQRDTSAPALSSADVFTLCQRIVKAAASLKTSRGDMEDHFKKTEQTIDRILRQHQGEEVGSIGNAHRKIATWYYKTNALYAGALHRHIEGVGYDVCVGFLEYAKKSLNSVIVVPEAA